MEIDDLPAIKSIERRSTASSSRSVRAEIQHQNAVTVLHTAVAVNRRRFDELIRRTRFVDAFTAATALQPVRHGRRQAICKRASHGPSVCPGPLQA